jgi:hypothetical protein
MPARLLRSCGMPGSCSIMRITPITRAIELAFDHTRSGIHPYAVCPRANRQLDAEFLPPMTVRIRHQGRSFCHECSDGADHLYYHTGDVATRDADGYLEYVGRGDDILKVSDYRLSPFELKSALIEHQAVGEALWCPARTVCAQRCRRPLSFCARATNPARIWPVTCSPSFERVSLHTNAFGVWSSPTCRKPFRARPGARKLRLFERDRVPCERRTNEFFEEDFPPARARK